MGWILESKLPNESLVILRRANDHRHHLETNLMGPVLPIYGVSTNSDPRKNGVPFDSRLRLSVSQSVGQLRLKLEGRVRGFLPFRRGY